MQLGDLNTRHIVNILNCFDRALSAGNDTESVLSEIQRLQLICDQIFLEAPFDSTKKQTVQDAIHRLGPLLLFFLRYPEEYWEAEYKSILINSRWSDQPIIDRRVKEKRLQLDLGM